MVGFYKTKLPDSLLLPCKDESLWIYEVMVLCLDPVIASGSVRNPHLIDNTGELCRTIVQTTDNYGDAV